MDIYESLIEFFEISTITSTATIVDLINYIISVSFAVYIVAFIIRSLFLLIVIPDKEW